MKKILSALLVLTLMLSLGTTAMAAEKTDKGSNSSEAQPAISEADAAEIALEQAGAETADNISCKLNKDNYTVQFKIDQTRYKYTISSIDGSVLKEDVSSPRVTADESDITKYQAEEIALTHVGIERTAVKYIHAYKEYSHGVPYAYHVEFAVYNAEASESTTYAYQVDLHTGEISSIN